MATPMDDWGSNTHLPQRLRDELATFPELSDNQVSPETPSPSLQPDNSTNLSHVFTEYPAGYKISQKPLTGGFDRVRFIAYTQAVPEYPITHPEGVAYIVDIRHLPEDDVKIAYADVQYGNDVTESLWDRLYDDRERVLAARARVAASDRLRISTYNIFLEQKSRYQEICGTQCEGGQMVLRQFQDGSGWFIGCSQFFLQRSRRHLFFKLPTLEGLDIDYLRDLILNNAEPPLITNQDCETLLAPSSRLTACGAHGPDMIEVQGCEVKTMVIKPKNLTALPLIVYASWGTHSHPPPPMTKTPHHIVSSVQDLIRKVDQRQITHGRFIRSDVVRDFLARYQLPNFAALHPSLGCRDMLLGTYLEYLQESSSPCEMYIQEMYTNGNNIRIICFTLAQAQYWAKIHFFQMDMTFKRVAGNINEVVFVTKDDTLGQVIVLARVFVNCDSTEMYFELFKALFQKIAEVARSPVQWHHIHRNGIQAVIVDMCAKQASGFGHYLTTIDPTRTWQQHVQSIFLYCQVHFQRNLNRFRRAPDYHLMKSILTVPSQEGCMRILNGLKGSLTPGVTSWATHKIRPWILSGLNPAFSLMPTSHFKKFPKHTNLTEGLHATTNRSGIQIQLRPAIQESHQSDLRSFEDLHRYSRFGVRPTHAVTTPTSRSATRPRQVTPPENL
ncbi:uncharacterized protein N7477_000827 [Penicillium maclennaniae]|nr:uncharacterized protein N7477_000827 [Penicillium maclennaniae]KAJ5684482.1 hypothetical protein N7477_000827 [Penicillium maclennaniae]